MRLSSPFSKSSLQKQIDPVKYHSSLANSWTARYQSRGFSRRLALFRHILSSRCKPGSVWLDAGCGSGVLSRELVALGARGKGIDASPAMIGLASSESKFSVEQFGFETVEGLEKIRAKSASLDGILCSSVLEYVDHPTDALKEFTRLLKPNGILILSVPYKFSTIRTLQALFRIAGRCIGMDLFAYLRISRHAFTQKEISLALSKLGFAIIQTELFDPVLPKWLYSIAPPSLLVFVAEKKSLS
jgi:2-polyprenyl-3-methyl-5-hydroxy-6-metoxy-1,4-benzoquinol methylase